MSKTTGCHCHEMGLTESAGTYYPVPEDLVTWIRSYDLIVVNSSAGKDSQAQLDLICKLAEKDGVLGRVVVAHCDLGEVEWAGTRELAETQAKFFGVRFEAVSREQGDLLHQIEFEREDWPGKSARFCTSDQKTSQIAKLITRLVAEMKDKLQGRRARVLSALGLRKQESVERRICTCCKNKEASEWKKGVRRPKHWVPKSLCQVCQGTGARQPLELDLRHSSGVRLIDEWLPILDWTTEQVWAAIKASGCPSHRAYDLGMPRLSCCFCVFASKNALVLAAKHNPELAEKYLRLEQKIGRPLAPQASMAEVVELAQTSTVAKIEDWDA